MVFVLLCVWLATISVTTASSQLASPEGGTTILDRSQVIQEEGFKALNKGLDFLDRAFSFVESQNSACDDDPEIKKTLDSILDRLDRIEAAISALSEDETDKAPENEEINEKLNSVASEVIERVNKKLNSVASEFSEKVDYLQAMVINETSSIEKKLDTSLKLSEKSIQLGTTIQTRQKVWLSEIRLISLFKLTGENNPHSSLDYNPGLAVDGQFVFSTNSPGDMRTYTHPRNGAADNKIWIKLGALFRVYSVRVWNIRDGSQPRFSGTNIYVDETLVGTASGNYGFHDFTLPEEKVVYGSKVTLHQPRADYIIVLEVQVWGNGPYNSTDLFN